MQQTQFNTPAEFNEAMRLAHLNDNSFGILSNIYDDEYPHPYFDPAQIGFYRYRNYNHQQYTSRNDLPDKSIVFEDFEMYIPGVGDLDHKLTYNIEQCPLTERDYIITACITKNDHMWPVPYVYNNYHFIRTHITNKKLYISPNVDAKYSADILLGNPKSHRNTFFKLLRANNMLDSNIINLFGVYKSSCLDDLDGDTQKILNAQNIEYKMTTHDVSGNFLSQYIPVGIYQNSLYSVVGETISNNDCFFVTEKTAKPMMAGRPFIMLSGKHTLKHLRDIGFKTFDPVINESYDEIDDEYERISAALISFKNLCTQDPSKVYTQLYDVLEHNRKIMSNKSLLTQRARNFLDNIQQNLV
jgi:hypothetical protein